ETPASSVIGRCGLSASTVFTFCSCKKKVFRHSTQKHGMKIAYLVTKDIVKFHSVLTKGAKLP
ncbi:hypothetical protein Q4S26_22200, partial [Morganella morganii]